MDSREYRRALAEIVVVAAQRCLIPCELRVGKRYKVNDMRTVNGATLLVNSLAASDRDLARWMAVEPLSPEINTCITWLPRMERAEEYAREGEAELARLRAKALADLAVSWADAAAAAD